MKRIILLINIICISLGAKGQICIGFPDPYPGNTITYYVYDNTTYVGTATKNNNAYYFYFSSTPTKIEIEYSYNYHTYYDYWNRISAGVYLKDEASSTGEIGYYQMGNFPYLKTFGYSATTLKSYDINNQTLTFFQTPPQPYGTPPVGAPLYTGYSFALYPSNSFSISTIIASSTHALTTFSDYSNQWNGVTFDVKMSDITPYTEPNGTFDLKVVQTPPLGTIYTSTLKHAGESSYFFYTTPEVIVGSTSMPCQNGSIILSGKYKDAGWYKSKVSTVDEKAYSLNAKLEYSSTASFTSKTTIHNYSKLLTTTPTGFTYDDIFGSGNNSYVGKQMYIRAVTTFGSNNYYSAPQPIYFLPIANVTVVPQNPPCNGSPGKITITNNSHTTGTILLTMCQLSLSSTVGTQKFAGEYYIVESPPPQTYQIDGLNDGQSITIQSSDLKNQFPSDPNIDRFLKGTVGFSAFVNSPLGQCPVEQVVNFVEPQLDEISVTGLTAISSCTNSINITYTSTGHNPPINLKVDGTAYSTNPYPITQATKTFTFSGTYGSNLCTAKIKVNGSETNTLTVNKDPTVTLTLNNKLDVVCNGGSTGEIRASLSPTSTTGCTFNFNGSPKTPSIPTAGTLNFTGFSAGSYTVTGSKKGSDNVSCAIDVTYISPITSTTISINQPNPFSITADYDRPNCNGDQGRIKSITPSGGTSPFEYSVNGSSYSSTITYNFFNANDVETINVKDNCGVIKTTSYTVPFISPVDFDASGYGTASCNSTLANNGSVTLTGKGGKSSSSGYKYKVDDGTETALESSHTFSDLTPGNHTLLITDVNACKSVNKSFNIGYDATSSMALAVSPGSKASCSTVSDATATLVLTQGRGVSPFTYAQTLPTSKPLTSTSLTELSSNTTYKYKVTDNVGCSAFSSDFKPEQYATPLAVETCYFTNATCQGGLSGTITIKGKDGFPLTGNNYTFKLYNSSWAEPITSNSPIDQRKIFSSLANGSYSAVIRDNKGCEVSQNVNVGFINTSPVSLSLLAKGDQICSARTNGYFKVSATTDPSFNIISMKLISPAPIKDLVKGKDIITGKDTAGLYSLPENTYIVKATDNAGCSSDITISIINKRNDPKPELDRIDSTACAGATNGALRIKISHAIPASSYTFTQTSPLPTKTLNSNGDPVTFPNLKEGPYNIKLTDNLGCNSSADFEVKRIVNPVKCLLPSTTPANCSNATNGKVSISATNGAPSAGNYTFKLNTGQIKTGSSVEFTGLNTTTTYSVTVTDGAGCTDNSVNFNIPTKTDIIGITPGGLINASCPGNDDGQATFTVTNAVQRYRGLEYKFYSYPSNQLLSTKWSSSNYTYTDFGAGQYTATVTDSFNCQATTPEFTVSQPSTAYITESNFVSKIKAKGGNDGLIAAQILYGNQNFDFEWYKGNTVVPANRFSNGTTTSLTSVNNLTAGTYMLRVRDTKLCIYDGSDPWFSKTYTIVEPATALAVATTSVNVSCNGLTNGQVTLSGSGGWAPYTYSLTNTPGSYQSSGIFSGLAAGNYTGYVKDSEGIIASKTFSITQPSVYAAKVESVKDASCYGYSDGIAYLSFTGGTPPYLISSNNIDWANDTKIESLPYGSHSIYTKDANNCISNKTATISQPTEIKVISSSTVKSICSGNNGSVSVQVSGGEQGYTYAWRNSSVIVGNSNILSNAGPGSYILTVTDIKGCHRDFDFDVRDTIHILTATSQIQKSICGQNNARIAVNVSGGTPAYIYTWTDNTGIIGNDDILENITAGTYSLNVTDVNNCSQDFSFTAPDSSYLLDTETPLIQNSICGQKNALISVKLTGGVPAYTYSWTGPSGFTSSSDVLKDIYAGTYTLEATDFNKCRRTFEFNAKDTTHILTVSDTLIQASICGQENALLSVELSGGTPDYTYSWTGPDGFVSNSNILNNIFAGIYTLTSTDKNNCKNSFNLIVPDTTHIITVSESLIQKSICGQNNALIAVKLSGGTPDYNYTWTGPDGVVGNSDTLKDIYTGSYSLAVTDKNNCTGNFDFFAPDTTHVLIVSNQMIQKSICGQNNAMIAAGITGGTPDYTYTWTGPNGFIGNSDTIKNIYAGLYTLTATDINSCTNSFNFIAEDTVHSINIIDTLIEKSICGQSNALIAIKLSGGTPDYSYNWTGPAGFTGNSDTLKNILAGLYTLNATDINNCSGSFDLLVEDTIHTLTVTDTLIEKSICGQNNALIAVKLSGGTPDYIYNWQGPAGFIENSDTLRNLKAGSYTLTVTDKNTCSGSFDFMIGDTIHKLIVADTFIQKSICGQNNALIGVRLSGGTPDYNYIWSGPSGILGNDDTLKNINSGLYTLTATDHNKCRGTFSFTAPDSSYDITIEDQLIQKSICKQNNSFIAVKLAGGTPQYTYKWTGPSGFAGDTDTLRNIYPGVYTLTATDLNKCSETFTIDAPDTTFEIIIADTLIEQSKCGQKNGFIAVSLSGGTPDYNYVWTNGTEIVGYNDTLENILAGSYLLIASDINNCKDSFIFNVSDITNLTINNIITTPVSCFDFSDGTAEIQISKGNPPYLINWPDGSGNSIVNGLSAGTYSVSVVDQENCKIVESFNITEPDSISLDSYTYNNPSCKNVDNGDIEVSISGGVAPYTYLWNNGDNDTHITGLAPGSYYVAISDANNCLKNYNFSLIYSSDSMILSSASLIKPSCINSNNGVISISIAGGKVPYSYVWNNGSTSNILSGLSLGKYNVEVTDKNNCRKNLAFSLDSYDPDSMKLLSSSLIKPSCITAFNGRITVNITGGKTPYSYLWSNGSTINAATNLALGSYSLAVTDGNKCAKNLSFSLDSYNPDSMKLSSSSIIKPSCVTSSNGSITLNITGGKTPYSYLWSNGIITSSATNLALGNYNIAVTDADKCVKKLSFSLDSYSADSMKMLSSSSIKPSCSTSFNGGITVNITGGKTPYSYLWSNGNTTNSATNLALGNYSLSVTDANKCVKKLSFSLDSYSPDSMKLISSSLLKPSCSVSYNGSITVGITGGKTPYSYLWSDGSTANPLASLSLGNYSLAVTDGNKCVKNFSFTLDSYNPDSMVLKSSNLIKPSCSTSFNGGISTNISGGKLPYTYLWSNGSTTNIATNLDIGEHTLAVTDGNKCVKNLAFNLSSYASDSMVLSSVSVTKPSCAASINGSILLSITGGKTPYTYLWNTGSTTNTINNLALGNYKVEVTDGNNCTKNLAFTIDGYSADSMKLLSSFFTRPSCANSYDGGITVNISGGKAPYSYVWSNGSTANSITGLSLGSYTIAAKDDNKCVKNFSFSLNSYDPDSMKLLSSSIIKPSCVAAHNGSISFSITGGKTPYSYLWNSGSKVNPLTGLSLGKYTVSVTDGKKCVKNYSFSLNNYSADTMLLQSYTLSNPLCKNVDDGEISISVSGGKKPYSYLWSNGSTGRSTDNLSSGRHYVKVTDNNKCLKNIGFDLNYEQIIKPNLSPDFLNLCYGSSSPLSIDGYDSYKWYLNNEVISMQSSIVADKTGVYKVEVIDIDGCEGSDSLSVNVSPQVFSSEFLMTNQAHVGDTVILIEISWPAADSIDWKIGGVYDLVTSQVYYKEIIFKETGTFDISLIAHKNECTDVNTKEINIIPLEEEQGLKSARENLIKSFTVSPNPSRGIFRCNVKLSRDSDIRLRLINLSRGSTTEIRQFKGNDNYDIDYNLPNLPSGAYVLYLEAGMETRTTTIMIIK